MMNSIEDIKAWYGELRTQKGNTIVIRDDHLPVARTGRIYLYNTERDAVIEYDETIVAPKLFPLDKAAQKKAESDYSQAWLDARELFLQAHSKGTPVEPQPVQTVENINPDDDMILEKED